MRTRVIKLRTGSSVTLYLNEETQAWTSKKEDAFDLFHRSIIEGKGNKAAVIRKYYSQCTEEQTRKKIRDMVNEGKTDLLHKTILSIRG